jgi:hypothetical protein
MHTVKGRLLSRGALTWKRHYFVKEAERALIKHEQLRTKGGALCWFQLAQYSYTPPV